MRDKDTSALRDMFQYSSLAEYKQCKHCSSSVYILNSVQAVYSAALPPYLMVFFIQTALLIMPHPQLFGQEGLFYSKSVNGGPIQFCR